MSTIISSSRRNALAVLLALAALVAAAPAFGQAEDQATARALFNEARALMKDQHFDLACPKLEAASRLYNGSGILLNLGDCYEHVGRTASAWTEFGEAASVAERNGRSDDQAEARSRQAAVEPRLTRMAIKVHGEVPGLVVKRDDSELPAGVWGVPVPVDPGAHTVTATAPGRSLWATTVAVKEVGATVVVEVPELSAEPVPKAQPEPALPIPVATTPAVSPAPAPENRVPPSYWTPRRIVGGAIVGVGAVALGAGVTLGFIAKSEYSKALDEAGPLRNGDSITAVTTGNVATAVVAVGAAAMVGGFVVWLTAPNPRLSVGTNGQRVVVGGSF
jgi:serine/threonine-protein kinase